MTAPATPVERMVTLDDPFEPEWAGLAEAAEPYRRACWQGAAIGADASTQAWARTRLAVNLLLQGQHRHAQTELLAAVADGLRDAGAGEGGPHPLAQAPLQPCSASANLLLPPATTLAPRTLHTALAPSTADTAARRALQHCAQTLAAAPLSVRVEPVVQQARDALAACRAALATEPVPAYLVSWALAAADTWLELDPEPTPSSRQALWDAVAPLWPQPQVLAEPASLPWLIRFAHHLAAAGPGEPGTWQTVGAALQAGLVARAAQGDSRPAQQLSIAAKRPAAEKVRARPLPYAAAAQRLRNREARWHPLARARGVVPPGLASTAGDGPGAPLSVAENSPWRVDAGTAGPMLASIAALPWSRATHAATLRVQLARALVAWATSVAQNTGGKTQADTFAAAEPKAAVASGTASTGRSGQAPGTVNSHGALVAQLHLAAARLLAEADDVAIALATAYPACGLRITTGSPDHANARALLARLSAACCYGAPAAERLAAPTPQRVALAAWLQMALPARPDACQEATQQAELALLAGQREESLQWRLNAVRAARTDHGNASAALLHTLQNLRSALLDIDPEHPDLEELHDEGTDLARSLHGAASAACWWWRGIRAVWWHDRGHGRALQVLAEEARSAIAGTVATGDREACIWMRELIDAAARVARRGDDDNGPEPIPVRLQ